MLSEQAIIGYFKSSPIYQLLGSEGNSEGETTSAGGSSNIEANESGQSAASDPSSESEKTGQSAQNVSREDYDRLQNQLSAADKKRAEYESKFQEVQSKLQQIEDKDKTDLEKVQNRAQELEQSVQQLTSQLQQMRLENAFLKDANFAWHDPSDVLRFVTDDDSVSIDEKGNVSGMEAALKKLAEKKPYLVKTTANTPSTPSGDPTNSGGKKMKNTNDEELRRKYPALRR